MMTVNKKDFKQEDGLIDGQSDQWMDGETNEEWTKGHTVRRMQMWTGLTVLDILRYG